MRTSTLLSIDVNPVPQGAHHRLSPPPPPLVDSAQGSNALGFFLGHGRPQPLPYDPAPFCSRRISRSSHDRPRSHNAQTPRQGAQGRHRSGRLPAEDPDRARLRRRHRIAARAGEESFAPPGQPGVAETGRHPTRLQLQAAGGLQQDVGPECRPAQAGRDLRIRRQPRTRGGTRRPSPGLQGPDRDAGDHTEAQDRRGTRARRRGGAARRELLRRLPARPRTRAQATADLRPPFRRPRRDRRPGHDRDGNPAPAADAHRRCLRRHRGRRPRVRRGGVHQVGAPRDQGDRRADHRLRCHGALGQGW